MTRKTSDHKDYEGQTDYQGLVFDFSDSSECSLAKRDKIFWTALWLKDRMMKLVSDTQQLHNVDLTVQCPIFQELASRLDRESGQDLKGVSTEALVTLYFQIVNAKRCLDAHLAEPTSSVPFTPTQFSTIASDLVSYDNEIQKAKNAQAAAMDCINK